MAGLLSERGYARLLQDVGALLAEGRAQAETLAGHVLAVTYWQVGERIGREALSQRAGYGDGVVAQLADELGVSHATLGRALRFARLYEAPPEPGLSWAHYQELLAVPDPQARQLYAERAQQEGWSKRQLRQAIVEQVFELSDALPAPLNALQRPADASYLYRCEVKQVLDGDTLIVHVDLGFEVIKAQRLRLARVDAPEAKTAAGKRASAWLRERMAAAELVVARTEKPSDVHGRYVAHLFYSGDRAASAEWVFRHGHYLNGELVAKGLAVVAAR